MIKPARKFSIFAVDIKTSLVMKYPIGIQNFESLINDGYTYVDKTAHIYNLLNTGRYYFLSRPRRFGKALLISTMEAYFSGKREFFKGLAMENLETEWTEYPILHIDLNTGKYDREEELVSLLNSILYQWEQSYGKEENEDTLSLRFKGIIQRAYEKTGKQVVILIDEYDKPLLQAIGNEDLQTKYCSTLKAFYSVLKTQDRYIKFAFLTGVTKFGKVSIFSDLNNLRDISMQSDYSDICGISEKEIHIYFEESIQKLSSKNNLTYEETCEKLKDWYDGYHFEHDTEGVYNPFSLLNTFVSEKFSDYWFETGTPSFLVDLLKKTKYDLNDIQREEVSSDVLNSVDSFSTNPIPMIYKSGYLTIKGYNERFGIYRLGFPNKEVEQGFVKYLMPFYTPVSENKTVFFISNFIEELEQGKPELFMQRLQTIFANANYDVAGEMEKYFQNCMWAIFMMMGFYTHVERHTSYGRADIVIQTKDYIYILELKLDGSAESALQQIEDKGYAAPFAMDSRKLYKIGVNFSSVTRGIEEYVIR